MSRLADELRPITIEPAPTAADAAVIIAHGQTRVLCTASVAEDLPPWLIDRETGQPRHGWVTAEYNMLPGSTPQRKRRGGDSRGTEIQRLIGRTLRAACDLKQLAPLAVTCDCDVLVADGGTRTASINGAFIALALAIENARRRQRIPDAAQPIRCPVAAISVGLIDGVPTLDLDYELDVRADVDLNVAMNSRSQFIEVQGTAEGAPMTRDQLDQLLDLAAAGIAQVHDAQQAFLNTHAAGDA